MHPRRQGRANSGQQLLKRTVVRGFGDPGARRADVPQRAQVRFDWPQCCPFRTEVYTESDKDF